MKQAVNFRLSKKAINTLSLLEKKLHISRTAIVESALQAYAKKKSTNKNPLIEYAGVLGDDEANTMLKTIKEKKHNKKVDIQL